MSPDELLLRDIHLPEPIGWWPPAIGWWLLAGIAIGLILAVVLWWRWRARVRRSPAAIASRDLARLRDAWAGDGDSQRLIRELSTWLRRAGMSIATREQAAGLTGARWHSFLDELAGEPVFAESAGTGGRLLVEGPYRRDDSMSAQDGDRLIDLCERWLRAAARRSRS